MSGSDALGEGLAMATLQKKASPDSLDEVDAPMLATHQDPEGHEIDSLSSEQGDVHGSECCNCAGCAAQQRRDVSEGWTMDDNAWNPSAIPIKHMNVSL